MDYLNAVAQRFNIFSKIRFNAEVVKSVWDEKTNLWTVETSTGETLKGERSQSTANSFFFKPKHILPLGNILISAVGSLHKPR